MQRVENVEQGKLPERVDEHAIKGLHETPGQEKERRHDREHIPSQATWLNQPSSSNRSCHFAELLQMANKIQTQQKKSDA
jgi:hypothetical protein